MKSLINSTLQEYAFYIFASSFFFGIAYNTFGYLIFTIMLMPLIFKQFNFKKLLKNTPLIVLVLFFVWNFFVLMLKYCVVDSISIITKLLPFLIFPILFISAADLLKNNRIILNFYRVYIVSAVVSFCVCLSYALFFRPIQEPGFSSIYITYDKLSEVLGIQAYYLSIFYLLAIVFCVEILKTIKHLRKLFILLALILFVAVILLSSRTSYVILTFIVTPYFLSIFKKGTHKIIFTASVIFVSMIIVFSSDTIQERVVNFNKNFSSYSGTDLRLKLWQHSMDAFKDSPYVGYGYNKSQLILNELYLKNNFRRAYKHRLNSHNQFIQNFIDSGVLGGFLIFFLLANVFLNSNFKSLKTIVFILIFFSMSMESLFNRQYGILFFCFFICFFSVLKNK